MPRLHLLKKRPRINVIYDSEESENEVSYDKCTIIKENTRSGNMWTEVERDPQVFEFRGKDQGLNQP